MSCGPSPEWGSPWLGPEERLRKLQTAYRELISGQATATFRYVGNGVERELSYAKADLARLEREIALAEAEIRNTGPKISTIRIVASKGLA